MSRGRATWLFLLVVVPVLSYAVLFPLLTVDTIANVIAHASRLEARTLYLLLFLEGSRLLTTLVALVVVVAMLKRAGERPDARALVVALLFAVIAYEKAFASNLFPGHFQESLANTLRSAGVRDDVLRWLFGRIAWPVWPALLALLRFSVVFPRALDTDSLIASGHDDRQGLLRASTLAGADVGAFFRNLSRALLGRGGYQPTPLVIGAVVLITAHTILRASYAWYAVALLLLCLIVTNLRAAHHRAASIDRARIAWLLEGVLLALFLFLGSGAVLLLLASQWATGIALFLALLAPATLIICLAVAVLRAGAGDTQLNQRTVRVGTRVLGVTIAFGACYRVLALLAGAVRWPGPIAWAGATILTLLLFRPIVHAVDRARRRILEQSERNQP